MLIVAGFFIKTKVSFSETTQKYVRLTTKDGNADGVLEFSSLDNPTIKITGKTGISDSGKLEIYQATTDDLLNFLVYDEEKSQINPIIKTSGMKHLSDLDVNISDKGQEYTLPLVENGIFLIQIKKGNSIEQSFVIRSSFGSLANETKDKLVVWNQNFETLKSLQGEAKVTLYNLKNGKNIIESTNIDSDGMASVSLNKNSDLIIIESNGSVSLIPLNIKNINRSYSWSYYNESLISKKYFVFTDRPIYKPGDTVYFKSIIRDDDDARYSIPSGTVNVEVTKGWSDKNVIYKDVLNIDSNQGFVGGNFNLPKNLSTGEYKIKIITNEEIESKSYGGTVYFTVENYRKPEYILNVEAEKNEAIRGDELKFTISGEYYSGQPLNNVDVTYKVTSSSTYSSQFYSSTDNNSYYGGWDGEEIDQGTISLDKKGKGALILSSGKYDFGGEDKLLFVEFKYKDQTGNPASDGVNVFMKAGEISIYRSGNNFSVKTNQEINIPLLIKENKSGVDLSKKIKITLIRQWWEKYFNDKSKYPSYREKTETIGNYDLKTNSKGEAIFNFTPSIEGTYKMVTSLNDSKENPINKSFSFWVNDKYGGVFNNQKDNGTIKVSLEKDSFEPGETVKINLNSEISSRDVFLSFERGYQDRYKIVRIDDKEKTIEEKLLATDLPNIFVSAKSFTSSKFDGDSQRISINTDSKKIIYKLSTDKKNYGPGDNVTVDILATDINGNPLTSNLALWAVDKSIFALSDKNYGDVFENFWDERNNSTSDANSLEGIDINNSTEMGGCFLSGTKVLMSDGSYKSIETVKTGDKILTKLNDKSNNLIKTKVTATHKAQISGYLIINGKLKVTSNHILFINEKWSMAGLAKIGDQLLDKNGTKITINSIEYLNLKSDVYNLTTDKYHTYFADDFYVHNQKGGVARTNLSDTAYWNLSVNTDSNGKAQITFKLPDNLTTWVIAGLGADLETKAGEGSTEIKVNKELVIRPVLSNVLSSGDDIKISALVNNFTDKEINATVSIKTDAGQINSPISQKIKIAANEFSEINWDLKVGEGNKTANFEFKVVDENGNSDAIVQNIKIRSLGYWQQKSEFKKDNLSFAFNKLESFDKEKSKVNLTLGSNLWGSLPSAMSYLINYSYGCVEQTTSSLMAKLIAKKYPSIFSEALKNESKTTTVEDGLNRLKSLQNSDGSWSWWSGGDRDLFISSYVFMVLNEGKDLGFEIDSEMYESARNYLINVSKSSILQDKVVSNFGLSFSDNKDDYKAIEGDLNQLDTDYLAMAAFTNLQAGLSDSSKNGLDILINRMQISDAGNYWFATDPKRFGSNETSTALAIRALNKSGKYNNQVTGAINYLVQTRTNDYWANTFATLQSILAIVEFDQYQAENQTNIAYQVQQSNEIIKSGSFVGIQAKPINLELNPSTINGQTLNINKTGTGNLYANLTQKWWVKSDKGAVVDDKVEIIKTFTNAKDGSYNLIPGDLVDVTITINFKNGEQALQNGYSLIEDHLPAGLIPVNVRMLNEDDEETNTGYSYVEYLDDGVIIPINSANYNNTYVYKARVINEGTFSNPSTFFTMMYRPDIWGRSDFGTITISGDRKIDSSLTNLNIFKKYKVIWLIISGLAIAGVSFVVIKYVIKKKKINKI